MVASNPTETRMQRLLIRAYIKAEPSYITLMRPNLEKTPAGGLKKGPATAQVALKCRLVPFKKRLVKMTRDTPDGNIINLEYVLVAEHNANVQVTDYFQHDGAWYNVFSIEPNRDFRIAANITYRGKQVDDTWSG